MTDDEFEDYVRARYDRLCRVAFVMCGDRHGAEDLVQAALAKAYEAARRSPIDNLDAYVYRTLYTTNASWWRRRWSGERPTATVPETIARDEFDSAETRAAILAALALLPLAQRAVLALRFLEDMTEEDTARALGCAVGTVRSRTARALSAIRAAGVLANSEMVERGGAS